MFDSKFKWFQRPGGFHPSPKWLLRIKRRHVPSSHVVMWYVEVCCKGRFPLNDLFSSNLNAFFCLSKESFLSCILRFCFAHFAEHMYELYRKWQHSHICIYRLFYLCRSQKWREHSSKGNDLYCLILWSNSSGNSNIASGVGVRFRKNKSYVCLYKRQFNLVIVLHSQACMEVWGVRTLVVHVVQSTTRQEICGVVSNWIANAHLLYTTRCSIFGKQNVSRRVPTYTLVHV